MNICTYWAGVVLKWSGSLPSIPMILVRILLMSTFFSKCYFERTEINKETGVGPLKKHTTLLVMLMANQTILKAFKNV